MCRVSKKIRQFQADERGMALILVSIMLPVIIGFALLAIDMSRVNSLQNDLQKGADAFAIAAAAELDGMPDAITRADRALATLVDNQYVFADAGGGAQTLSAAGITRRYLSSIPTGIKDPSGRDISDSQPIQPSMVITNEVDDAKLARFVEVRVTPVGFRTMFPASFLTGSAASNTMNVGAVAVAGFSSGVCDYTPVFICNPYEDTAETGGVTLEQAAQTREYRRRQILMRYQGSWEPGNFAFLASPFGNGANALEAMLASVKPKQCYSREGVDTEPGQNSGPVKDGLNSRFGLAKTYLTGPNGPSQNNRAGVKSYNCNNSLVWETDVNKGVGLERDPCHMNGTCTMMGGRMGGGDWNFTRYWNVNHTVGGITRPVPAAISGTGADLPTRYEVYRQEIADGIVGDASAGGETGLPICGGTPITTVDRRILYGAIIDCQSIPGGFSGRAEDIPVRAFASFFITEPIKDDKDIYVELVDITGRGGRGTLDNFLRDEAQLYR